MRFEVTRLNNDNNDADRELTVVDANALRDLVDDAAAEGERLYIKPVQMS